MKKTLIISMEYPPVVGGIATYVHELAQALDPNKTIVLAPNHMNAKEWDSSVAYTVVREEFFFPKFIWPQWLRLYIKARKIVKKEGVKVVLIHHILPVGYVASLLKKKFKIPFLVFSHGTDLVAGTATRWKKKRMIQVSKAADQIIFNSQSLMSRYLQVLPEFDTKSRVMYPCPNVDFLTPPDAGEIDRLRSSLALEGKIVMLSVGRLVDGKGFTHVSRLLPQLVNKIPHLAWVIVGDGPKKDLIVGNIQKAGLQSIVRLIGSVPSHELKKYYYLADVFVLLTHPDEGKEEGLGLVFLEAAAAGLPTVAGKSGGVEEAVVHTQTGLVVDLYQGDTHIIDSVEQLVYNRSYSNRLASTAKERIQTNFIWEHQIQALNQWLLD